MKVSNREGIANQTGPESCVAHREVRDEALTGLERRSWVLLPDSRSTQVQAVAVIMSPLRRDRVSILTDSTFEQCGAWRLSCAQRPRPWSPKMIR